jgi:hypothetical protein
MALVKPINSVPIVEILSDEKQATLKEEENLDFILPLWSQMSSHSKFWAPYNEFTGFLKAVQASVVNR